MPASSFSAGSGNERMNIVSTGATNDIGQLTICENSIDRAVPSAMRNMRTLAILMRFASADAVLPTNEILDSEGISQEAGHSDIYRADEIEQPVVACVNNDRGLGANADTESFGPLSQLKFDLDREALRIAQPLTVILYGRQVAQWRGINGNSKSSASYAAGKYSTGQGVEEYFYAITGVNVTKIVF